ncbi:hypothetical protein [Dendronalium sp. ChiSLP03b]|uniref:hypothetical protein n=1 Tax=Dendronalium sp. ChiSLP03b TaxID=3075381 RepID=UPI002AD4BF71|nr:hypothetical protein [Dendronalium sp. ChiSLP03b]MDZ8209179.1 hypothetical protein [Dendronalium sp. ChiSLP03b]
MANVNGLTQLNNQEAVFEEINEEELEGVVGGGILGGVLTGLGAPQPAIDAVKNSTATLVFALLDILL